MVGRSLDPEFQTCLSHTFSLEPEGVTQVSAYLKASAHLLPALFELSEKAGIALTKAKMGG